MESVFNYGKIFNKMLFLTCRFDQRRDSSISHNYASVCCKSQIRIVCYKNNSLISSLKRLDDTVFENACILYLVKEKYRSIADYKCISDHKSSCLLYTSDAADE